MLTLLIPFLIEIVVNKVDVRHLLTDEIKQAVLYKSLDEGRLIPPVEELLERYAPEDTTTADKQPTDANAIS